jgi:hypothetical protein
MDANGARFAMPWVTTITSPRTSTARTDMPLRRTPTPPSTCASRASSRAVWHPASPPAPHARSNCVQHPRAISTPRATSSSTSTSAPTRKTGVRSRPATSSSRLKLSCAASRRLSARLSQRWTTFARGNRSCGIQTKARMSG